METKLPVLWIVIPCYNEEAVLPITAPMFLDKITQLAREGLIAQESRILFVNDGSKDTTWQIIQSLAGEDGTSECCSRGPHGSQGALRYYYLY